MTHGETDRQTDRQTCCPVSFVQTPCCTTPNSPIARVRSTVMESSLMRHRQTGTLVKSPLPPDSATFFTRICYHRQTHARTYHLEMYWMSIFKIQSEMGLAKFTSSNVPRVGTGFGTELLHLCWVF